MGACAVGTFLFFISERTFFFLWFRTCSAKVSLFAVVLAGQARDTTDILGKYAYADTTILLCLPQTKQEHKKGRSFAPVCM